MANKKSVNDVEKDIKAKVNEAKEKVLKRTESKPTDAKPQKKSKPKVDDTRTWLEKYIENPNSGAKIASALLARPNGATLQECSEKALEHAKQKGSGWGSKANIKSQIGYLKSKGCVVEETGEGDSTIYKVSSK